MRIGLNIGLLRLAGWMSPQTSAAEGFSAPGNLRPWSLWVSVSSIANSADRNLEAEEERWFPWYVVGFAAGIAIYFALAVEPSLTLAGAIGLLALALILFRPASAGVATRFLCAILAAAGFGFAAGKLQTIRVDAPVITRDVGPLEIVGRIEGVTLLSPNKARILLAPSKIGEDSAALPRRVRLTLTGVKAVAMAEPGSVISALAALRPPPEPAMPNGYDFARWAYFEGIGAVGFTYGAPKPVAAAPAGGALSRLANSVENLRLLMTKRVAAAVPGTDGSVAAALITGERGSIDEDDLQAYRDSGLAHVLSISGLHLTLAGLGVFWIFRALLALSPRLTLTQPIKKWAAVAAFLSASFYLAISGGGSPAIRSYLMLSMMLLGVLADRPVLSMRGVALAALVLLVVAPDDLVEPGFQMSFAAVIGLIALAEWGASRPRPDLSGASYWSRLWRKTRLYVTGLVLASMVATLATTPFAIYHFDRAASYSLLANLLAEPVVAFLIMPMAALAVVLMPFGLEAQPLHLMGSGVHMMTAIAHFVADLPGAATLVRSWPALALVAMASGGLWIALWRRAWRWFGLIPIALGCGLAASSPPPDMFVARDSQSAAVRTSDGNLVILGLRPDGYTAAQWLLRDGDRRDIAAARAGARCDDTGCTAQARDGRLVALSLRVSALVEDCRRAKIIIAAVPRGRGCSGPELVLDRFDTARHGAAAIRLTPDGLIVESVAALRGKRPWTAREP